MSQEPLSEDPGVTREHQINTQENQERKESDVNESFGAPLHKSSTVTGSSEILAPPAEYLQRKRKSGMDTADLASDPNAALIPDLFPARVLAMNESHNKSVSFYEPDRDDKCEDEDPVSMADDQGETSQEQLRLDQESPAAPMSDQIRGSAQPKDIVYDHVIDEPPLPPRKISQPRRSSVIEADVNGLNVPSQLTQGETEQAADGAEHPGSQQLDISQIMRELEDDVIQVKDEYEELPDDFKLRDITNLQVEAPVRDTPSRVSFKSPQSPVPREQEEHGDSKCAKCNPKMVRLGMGGGPLNQQVELLITKITAFLEWLQQTEDALLQMKQDDSEQANDKMRETIEATINAVLRKEVPRASIERLAKQICRLVDCQEERDQVQFVIRAVTGRWRSLVSWVNHFDSKLNKDSHYPRLSHLSTAGDLITDDYMPHHPSLDLELRKLSSVGSARGGLKKPTPLFYCSKHQQEMLSSRRPASARPFLRATSPARSVTPSRFSRSQVVTPRSSTVKPARPNRLSLPAGPLTRPRTPSVVSQPRSRTPSAPAMTPRSGRSRNRSASRHSARSSSRHSAFSSQGGSNSDLEHLDDSLTELIHEASTYRAPPPPPPLVDLEPFYGYKMPCVFRCKFCGQTQPLYTPNNGTPIFDSPLKQPGPQVLLNGVEHPSKYADNLHRNETGDQTPKDIDVPATKETRSISVPAQISTAPISNAVHGISPAEMMSHLGSPMMLPNGLVPSSQFPNGLPPGSQILVLPPGYGQPGQRVNTSGFHPYPSALPPDMQRIMDKYAPKPGASDDDRPSKDELVAAALEKYQAKKKNKEKQRYLDSVRKKSAGRKPGGSYDSDDDEVSSPRKNKKLHSANPNFDSSDEENYRKPPSAKNLRELEKAAKANARSNMDSDPRHNNPNRSKSPQKKKNRFSGLDSDDETCRQEFPNRDRLESAMNNSLFDELNDPKSGKGKPVRRFGAFAADTPPSTPRNSKPVEARIDKDKERPTSLLTPQGRPSGMDLHKLELAAAAGAKWLGKVAKSRTPTGTPRKESKKSPIVHEPDDEIITATPSKPLHSQRPDPRRGSPRSPSAGSITSDQSSTKSPYSPNPTDANAIAPYNPAAAANPYGPESMAAKAAIARQLAGLGPSASTPENPTSGMINFGNVSMYIMQGDERSREMALNKPNPALNGNGQRGGQGQRAIEGHPKSPRHNSNR